MQALVPVATVEHERGLTRIGLDLGQLTQGLELGASVAVNGTCLTVTQVNGERAQFDVIPETIRTTNLGRLKLGDRVNVERSFSVGDEIGGHVVSGHVSTTAELTQLHIVGHDRVLTFKLGADWLKYVFHKGFIALDGASLTVSALDRDAGTFAVSLIPETIARTTLGALQVGELVNVEVDAQTLSIVDTVERVLAERGYAGQANDQD